MSARHRPTDRNRSASRLTDGELNRIRALMADGTSTKAIARALGRPPITIRRALARLSRAGATPVGCESKRREAAARAVAAVAAQRRSLRPLGISAEPGSREWFYENERSFQAGLRAAREASEPNIIGSGKSPLESHGMAKTGDAEVVGTITEIENRLGALQEIQPHELVLEIGYALGSEATSDRVREILRSPIARLRPGAAIDLATRSSLPADEVLTMLERMPPETDGSSPA